ncbi:MAG: hypothetical protein LBR75_04555 [Prevotellaceae bacterium]|jgi:hypothetical protein|nr:hypothetical protein [Prevotellaceae bacterium]
MKSSIPGYEFRYDSNDGKYHLVGKFGNSPVVYDTGTNDFRLSSDDLDLLF